MKLTGSEPPSQRESRLVSPIKIVNLKRGRLGGNRRFRPWLVLWQAHYGPRGRPWWQRRLVPVPLRLPHWHHGMPVVRAAEFRGRIPVSSSCTVTGSVPGPRPENLRALLRQAAEPEVGSCACRAFILSNMDIEGIRKLVRHFMCDLPTHNGITANWPVPQWMCHFAILFENQAGIHQSFGHYAVASTCAARAAHTSTACDRGCNTIPTKHRQPRELLSHRHNVATTARGTVPET